VNKFFSVKNRFCFVSMSVIPCCRIASARMVRRISLRCVT
jgi:hypothetical protein